MRVTDRQSLLKLIKPLSDRECDSANECCKNKMKQIWTDNVRTDEHFTIGTPDKLMVTN